MCVMDAVSASSGWSIACRTSSRPSVATILGVPSAHRACWAFRAARRLTHTSWRILRVSSALSSSSSMPLGTSLMCCKRTQRCVSACYAVRDCACARLLVKCALSPGTPAGKPTSYVFMQAKNFHGNYQDPTLYVQTPLQVAAEREVARYYFEQVCPNVLNHILSFPVLKHLSK